MTSSGLFSWSPMDVSDLGGARWSSTDGRHDFDFAFNCRTRLRLDGAEVGTGMMAALFFAAKYVQNSRSLLFCLALSLNSSLPL